MFQIIHKYPLKLGSIILSNLQNGKLLSLLVFVWFIGCTAYFNTFYNGEMAFNEGQQIHQELIKHYPDSLVVTPPKEVVTKYDRAIEKAYKTIETFEKNKKWHDDALFLMGKSYFFKMDMDNAIRRLHQLEKEFPSSEKIPEAQLYLARAYIEDGNLDKAEELLLNASKRFPELNNDHHITLLMITIALRRNGKSQAIALLEATMKGIRSDDVRLDLLFKTAELYIELKQYDKAILLLEKAPRKKKLPVQSYRIDRALFTCYKSVDSLTLAYNHISAMILNKNYSLFMDEMLYYKGVILYERGDVDEAIKVLKKLTAGIDSATVANDTSSFKAKALYELALIYQQQKEDYDKAAHYLTLAAATRDTSSNKPAKKRLSAMERLMRLRDGTEKGDSIPGGNQFVVGELFRFELDEPDSAFEQFIKISNDPSTDTGIVPKALLQAAIIARDELSYKDKSDSIFRAIMAAYPRSDYAKASQLQLGIPVTIKTRKDSAYDLYSEAERQFYQENDVKGAIKRFYDVYRLYPDEEIAPRSLFAAAWFSSTVLFKNRTSKMLYEKICDKYPKSIYCTQLAKPRIKVVIDTLAKLDELRLKGESKRSEKQKSNKKGIVKAATVDSSTADILGDVSDAELETEFTKDDSTVAVPGKDSLNSTIPSDKNDSP